jgi:hypothetical protein
MSSSGVSYETLYGVQLLDDLHNYFPALLYDSTRFRTVGDVLLYLQVNARNRFDLFSYGQRNYLHTITPPAPTPPPTRIRPVDLSGGVPAAVSTTTTSYRTPQRLFSSLFADEPQMSATVEMVTEDLGDVPSLNLMNLMNILGGLPPIRRPVNSSFMEPVVVRPTAQQITQATSQVHLREADQCAICLAQIETSQAATKINHCRHTFHPDCFNGWFRNNVTCPVCRHDIRETDNTSDTQSEGSTHH